MATINISLPDPMCDWVQTQIQEGKYSSTTDYVCDLIRRDQGTRRQQSLQVAISEGLKSDISNRTMEDILEMAQARLAKEIRHETITLQPNDFQTFLAALDKPSVPNAALQKAFKQHAEQVIN